jgi:hypothetical protein
MNRMETLCLVAVTLPLHGLQLPGGSASPAQAAAYLQPSASVLGAELREVRGTRIRVDVPPDFSPAGTFTGLEAPERGLAIMVTELPAPFEEIAAGFGDRQALARQGMKVLKREDRKNGRYSGVLLEVEQRTRIANMYKWIWAFGDQEQCVMVIGACSLDQAGTHTELLSEIVLSSVWDVDREVDPDSGLTFELGDTAGLERVDVTSGALGYRPTEDHWDEDGGRALLVCAPGMAAAPADRDGFARGRIQQTATYRDIAVESVEPVEVDGLQGHAVLAKAIDEKNGDRSFIYQVTLSEGMTYWIMSGMGPQAQRAELLPLFRRVTSSFRRKREKLVSAEALLELSVPASWAVRGGIDDTASLQAGASAAGIYLVVFCEAKAGLERGLSLREYSASRRKGLEQQALAVGEPVELEIGGRRALQIELDLPLERTELHYVHVSVDGGEHFHELMIWCPRETYVYSRGDIEAVVGSLREMRDE